MIMPMEEKLKKFEYDYESNEDIFPIAILNSKGQEGWELIGPPVWDSLYRRWVFCFKRETQ